MSPLHCIAKISQALVTFDRANYSCKKLSSRGLIPTV